MMIALMERAACDCLELAEGQTSVGVGVCVEHIAASPLGAEITATAVVERVDGRKIEFAVSAIDSTGEIGRGKHTRFIVDAEKFMGRTNKKQ
jgi:predicted thioesterase